VTLTSAVKLWLEELYEERNPGNVLRNNSIFKIHTICKGKFRLLLNGAMVFLVVIPSVSSVLFPCQTSIQPYGLCNGKFLNVLVDVNAPQSGIVNAVIDKLYQSRLLIGTSIRGIIFIPSGSNHRVRLILNVSETSDQLLKWIKENFGNLSFCSDTHHFVPNPLKERIAQMLSTGRDVKGLWPIIKINDILQCGNDEMSIVKKANLSLARNHSPEIYRRVVNINQFNNHSNNMIRDPISVTLNRISSADHTASRCPDSNNNWNHRSLSRNRKMRSVVIIPDKQKANRFS
jgi:hypothetical protein